MSVGIAGYIKNSRVRLSVTSATLALTAFAVPSGAFATGTLAGTTIQNTASATFDAGNGTDTVSSNTVTLTVDELLDVTVASTNPSDVPTTPGATQSVLTFNVTNNGNGDEAFTLGTISTNGGDDYDPTNVQIWLDNGDGVFDPTVDTLYVPGSNDPLLAPDQSRTVFVVADTPGGVADGGRAEVVLTAESNTVLSNGNNNTPGHTMVGLGPNGGNAVVGSTGADSEDEGFYRVNAATVALVKSAVVKDMWGGAEPIPGAIITYTITANITGSGSIASLNITDPVPAGTTYVPGTITVGGTAQTDAVDSDAGSFTGNIVSANVGTVNGGQSRTVTFDVKIN